MAKFPNMVKRLSVVVMAFLFCIGVPLVRASDDCAGVLGSGTISPSENPVHGVVIYISFPGQDSTVPSSAIAQVETSMPAFISNMSYGVQTISLTREAPYSQAPTIAWVAYHSLSYYGASDYPSGYPDLFEEILDRVHTKNSNAFSGKDFVSLIALGDAWPAFGGEAYHDSLFPGASLSWDNDGFVADLGSLGDSNSAIATLFAHEYMHLLGLGDRGGNGSSWPFGGRTGVYDLMYHRGTGGTYRLRPLCSRDLNWLGWIRPDSIQVVNTNATVSLKDIRQPSQGSKILCKLPLPPFIQDRADTLLIENHQKTGADSVYSGKGLLIWHLRHNSLAGTTQLDVEVAVGVPGSNPPNPNADWLDSLYNPPAGFNAYSRKGDFWGGDTSINSGETSFTPATEPNTNTWHVRSFDDSDGSQGSRTTVSILNIRAGTGSDIVFDVKFDYTLASNETWPGNADDALLLGDVTVPNGKALTIQAGKMVRVATTDRSQLGDPARCELIVKGKLVAEGKADSIITLRSTNSTSTAKDDWYGVVLDSTADASSIVKYATIKNASYAVYCNHLSPTVTNNTITYSTVGVKGVSMDGSGSISRNTISNTITAVSMTNSSVPVSYNNLSSNVRSGYFTGTASTMQYDTLGSNSNEGISLFSDSDVKLGHDRIVGNALWGLWLWSGSDPLMEGAAGHNRITDNGTALSPKPEVYCMENSRPQMGTADSLGHNDIYDANGGWYVYMDINYTMAKVTAKGNWWNTTDSLTIRGHMSPPDSVVFSPWSNGANTKPIVVPGYPEESLADRLVVQGQDAENSRDYSRAIEIYRRVLAAYPRAQAVRAALGGLHRSYGASGERFGEFRGLMQTVVATHPDPLVRAKAASLARLALVAAGAYAQAVGEYQALVDQGGTEALAAKVHIGEIYLYYLKDVSRAKAILAEVIAEAPDRPEAFAAKMALDDPEAMPRSAPMMATTPEAVAATLSEESPRLQNTPNPFNPTTVLAFDLPQPATVRLVIYDNLGQTVRTLLDRQPVPAGRQMVSWDGRDSSGRAAPSGVYFARLNAGAATGVRRLLLLK